MRGIAAGAFLVAIAGAYFGAAPAADAVPAIYARCETVNDVGDCVSETPGEQDADSCVLVNELGACEDQQEVENPPHAMLK
ncbi:hypothetical protein BI330_11595 [Mycobacterium sp. CBMA 623]|nr:hypothetical protein [Mycobacteroides sp. CBMA 326]